MCGIAGVVDYNKVIEKTNFKSVVESLKHRGNDASGTFYSIQKPYFLALGHQRLSILDLSTNANQPMSFNGITIAYNGEVYNYLLLKQELQKAGYNFFSTSDTEVILKMYDYYGVNFIKKLNGMFSISIYDSNKNLLFLIRDRIGIKPLHYSSGANSFHFSSELKSLLKFTRLNSSKQISQTGMQLFLRNGYIKSPYTIWENCKKVNPATYLEIDLLTKTIKEEKYWVPKNYTFSNTNNSLAGNIKILDDLVNSSVEMNLISDVPIGVFLSGGIDSSLITAIAKQYKNNLDTFAIGFENDEYNEAPHAKRISKYFNTNHHEFYMKENEFINVFEKLPYVYDEPISDNSVIPTLFLSEKTKINVTVSLSGDGGDELFAGYLGHLRLYKWYLRNKKININLRAAFSKLFTKTCSNISNMNYHYKCQKLSELIESKNILEFRDAYLGGVPVNILNKMMNYKYEREVYEFDNLDDNINMLYLYNFLTILPEQLLTKVDRASMYYTLEVRVPLLDHRIVEAAFSLDESMKVYNNIPKYILRKLLYNYIPARIVEKPKKGFTFPYWQMLNETKVKKLVYFYISEKNLKNDENIDFRYLLKLRDNFYNSGNVPHHIIWRILNYAMWKNTWM